MNNKIHGNIESIRKSTLERLESVYGINEGRGKFLPEQVAAIIAEVTRLTNKEVAVLIDRSGKVVSVAVGDHRSVGLHSGNYERKSESWTSGIRCIHTHPNGDANLSEIDLNNMRKLRYDAIASIGVSKENGAITGTCVALNDLGEENEAGTRLYCGEGMFCDMDCLMGKILENDKKCRGMAAAGFDTSDTIEEKAILIGCTSAVRKGRVAVAKQTYHENEEEAVKLLDELEQLAITAGAQVLEKVLYKNQTRDAAYHIGRGKAEELFFLRQKLDANLIVFDDELSGAQTRNLEELTGVKVIDRTTLILDIFAGRAMSKEGKLQVELAQLKYHLSRLTGMGIQLSRLGGGIGTRGPGEKKLDIDRRHIRRRVGFIENELKDMALRRNTTRRQRKEASVPIVAIVGYTNAGKSTLFNKLCGADSFIEDKLFATLDPTSRKLDLPNGRNVVLVDTVGFIRKLPHELIESFKATLEEAVYADALLHVVDASGGEADRHIEVVEQILGSIGAGNKKTVLALNKMDKLDPGGQRLPLKSALRGNGVTCCEISASTGFGIDSLTEALSGLLDDNYVKVNLLLPYDDGGTYSFLHENAETLDKKYEENGIRICSVLEKRHLSKVVKYVISEAPEVPEDGVPDEEDGYSEFVSSIIPEVGELGEDGE